MQNKFKPVSDYIFVGKWTQPVIDVAAWIAWEHQPKVNDFKFKNSGTYNEVITNCAFLRLKDGLMSEIIDKVYDEIKLNKYELTRSFFEYLEEIFLKIDKLIEDYKGKYDSREFFVKAIQLNTELKFPWWNNFSISNSVDRILNEYSENNNIPLDRLTSLMEMLPNDVSKDENTLRRFRSEFKKLRINKEEDIGFIRKKSKKLAQNLIDYAEESEYIGTHHWWGDPRDITKLIEDIIKVGDKQQQKNPKVPKEIRTALFVAAKATKGRLDSAMVGARLGYSLREPLTKLAKNNNIEYMDIIYYTPEEILDLIDGKTKADINLLNERKKGFSMFYVDKKLKITTGKENEEVYNHFKSIVETKNIDGIIKGQIGCRGFAKGIVAILNMPKDNYKVKEGMILVASETTPEYIPAMRKAAAFVTDIGGITSHAAIVAREMGKPCIVGTKNATQNLKDGDLIEVDANKGTIRKIN